MIGNVSSMIQVDRNFVEKNNILNLPLAFQLLNYTIINSPLVIINTHEMFKKVENIYK